MKIIECDKCKREFSENSLSVEEITAFVVCSNCREESSEESEKDEEKWDLILV